MTTAMALAASTRHLAAARGGWGKAAPPATTWGPPVRRRQVDGSSHVCDVLTHALTTAKLMARKTYASKVSSRGAAGTGAEALRAQAQEAQQAVVAAAATLAATAEHGHAVQEGHSSATVSTTTKSRWRLSEIARASSQPRRLGRTTRDERSR